MAEFVATLDHPESAYDKLMAQLRMSPDDAETLNKLGLLLEHRGEFYAASYCYVSALCVRPNFPEAEFDLFCVRQQLAGGTP